MAAFSMQVCMDTSEWLKDIVSDAADTAGSMDNSNSSSPSATELICLHPPPPALERRLRPPHDQALRCPRCDSTHTKFCYYNNYSLSQPRYFCKTCRRYWTKGGSLRNVPVGGGCRKNKRSAAKKSQVADHTASQFIPRHHQVTDLQLSNLNFIFEGSSCLFMGSCDVGPGAENLSHGFSNSMELSIDEACQRLAMPFEAQEGTGAAEMKPGNRTLSLEWPERGDLNGCGNGGMGMWAEMVGGHGPSSSAAM